MRGIFIILLMVLFLGCIGFNNKKDPDEPNLDDDIAVCKIQSNASVMVELSGTLFTYENCEEYAVDQVEEELRQSNRHIPAEEMIGYIEINKKKHLESCAISVEEEVEDCMKSKGWQVEQY